MGCHSSVSPLYTGTGVGGEFLDVGLGVAAELDRVVHAAQDRGGVGDRFLVPELGSGRFEVGDVRALVVGGDLEGRTGPGRGLLEDQRDLLAAQLLDLGAGVLGQLERLGQFEQEAQLARRSKSISFRKDRFFRLNAMGKDS